VGNAPKAFGHLSQHLYVGNAGGGSVDKPPRHLRLGDIRPDSISSSSSSTGSASSSDRFRFSQYSTMSIPPEDSWGSRLAGRDCSYAGEDVCGLPVKNGWLSDLQSLDPAADGGNVIVTGARTQADEDLLRTAWAILKVNTDLIVWVVCWVINTTRQAIRDWLIEQLVQVVTGIPIQLPDSYDTTACILSKLFEISSTRYLELRIYRESDGDYDDWCEGWAASAWPIKEPNVIYICASGSSWRKWIGAWACGIDPNKDQFCAAVDLASTLLHELTHLCGRSPNDSADNCEFTYLIASTFKWAMMQRYSALLHSECCAKYDGMDELFMFDGADKIDNDCIDCGNMSSSEVAGIYPLGEAPPASYGSGVTLRSANKSLQPGREWREITEIEQGARSKYRPGDS